MSLKSTAISACSKCGSNHQITIYKSINVATEPQLKEKVLSGELFLWECPSCGSSNLVTYDCLYHDPDQKIMIWMLPGGEPSGKEKEAIFNQAKSMGDYKLRIVSNAGELMEKVIIFDAGMSDRVMEIVKYVSGKEMPEVSNLHFYRMQDDTMVFSGVKDGKMDGFGVGINVYEDCCGIVSRNPDLGEENGFARIDPAWVEEIMG